MLDGEGEQWRRDGGEEEEGTRLSTGVIKGGLGVIVLGDSRRGLEAHCEAGPRNARDWTWRYGEIVPGPQGPWLDAVWRL